MNSSIEVSPDYKVDELAMLTNGKIKGKTRPILAIKRQARKILLRVLDERKLSFQWPMTGRFNRVGSKNYKYSRFTMYINTQKGVL